MSLRFLEDDFGLIRVLCAISISFLHLPRNRTADRHQPSDAVMVTEGGRAKAMPMVDASMVTCEIGCSRMCSKATGRGGNYAFQKTWEPPCSVLLWRHHVLASGYSQNERVEHRGDSFRERDYCSRTLRVSASQEGISMAANSLKVIESFASACWAVQCAGIVCPSPGHIVL
jgi:hypothetical protein